jgi:acyl dehydratase
MGLYFEDLTVGDVTRTAGRTVTETDVVVFSGLTGDNTPIHTDAEFAKQTHFGQRVVHGPLGFTLAVGLAARLALFEDTAIAALGIQDWKFLAPIFIGDTLHVEIEIASKRVTSNPSRGVVDRVFRLIKQDGTVVQAGNLPMMVKTREAAVANA